MKVRASVKKMCDKCKVIRRNRIVRVIVRTQSINKDKDKVILWLVLKGASPHNKRLDIALTAIYGVGRVKAKELIASAFGDKAEEMEATRAYRLTDSDISKIRDVLQHWREPFLEDGSENPEHH